MGVCDTGVGLMYVYLGLVSTVPDHHTVYDIHTHTHTHTYTYTHIHTHTHIHTLTHTNTHTYLGLVSTVPDHHTIYEGVHTCYSIEKEGLIHIIA
jgi:hypothetical protein